MYMQQTHMILSTSDFLSESDATNVPGLTIPCRLSMQLEGNQTQGASGQDSIVCDEFLLYTCIQKPSSRSYLYAAEC